MTDHSTKIAGYAAVEGLVNRWTEEGRGQEFEAWIRGSGYLARPNDPTTALFIERCKKFIADKGE